MALQTFTVLVQQVAKVSFDPDQLTRNAALALSDDGHLVITASDLAERIAAARADGDTEYVADAAALLGSVVIEPGAVQAELCGAL